MKKISGYLAYLPCSLIAISLTAGCVPGMSRATVQETQLLAEQAFELEGSNRASEALPLIDRAIRQGGLDPDQLANAYLLRARCYCAAGKLDEAEQEIALAERGSPDPAQWHYTQATLLSKQGKTVESSREFSKAKMFNAALTAP
jgi:tetratricopeptide (TPR) repeat protein